MSASVTHIHTYQMFPRPMAHIDRPTKPPLPQTKMAVVTPEAAVLFVDPKKLSAEVTQVKIKNKKQKTKKNAHGGASFWMHDWVGWLV